MLRRKIEPGRDMGGVGKKDEAFIDHNVGFTLYEIGSHPIVTDKDVYCYLI